MTNYGAYLGLMKGVDLVQSKLEEILFYKPVKCFRQDYQPRD